MEKSSVSYLTLMARGRPRKTKISYTHSDPSPT